MGGGAGEKESNIYETNEGGRARKLLSNLEGPRFMINEPKWFFFVFSSTSGELGDQKIRPGKMKLRHTFLEIRLHFPEHFPKLPYKVFNDGFPFIDAEQRGAMGSKLPPKEIQDRPEVS